MTEKQATQLLNLIGFTSGILLVATIALSLLAINSVK
jgi:hypothetical protein